MGCGMSTEEKEGKERNEQIENQLKRDKLSQRNEIKMLLLGKHRYSLDFRARLTPSHRCWRIRQIYNFKTDEAHSRGKLLSR